MSLNDFADGGLHVTLIQLYLKTFWSSVDLYGLYAISTHI